MRTGRRRTTMPSEHELAVQVQTWGSEIPRIVEAVREQPWAIRQEKLAAILDLLRFRCEGGRLTPDEIRERIGTPRACDQCDDDEPLFSAAASRPQTRTAGAVAIIPIFGVIVQRASMLAQSSGAQGTE